MEYDAVILHGTGLADYAGPGNPAIVLTRLDLLDIETLSRIIERQNGIAVCFLPHKENG